MTAIKPMVWVDIETTGLEPTIDQLLEVAVVITDEELRVQDSIKRVIATHKPFQEVFALAGPYVQAMHEKSGLWRDLRASKGESSWAVESVLLEFLADWFPFGSEKPPMCGSSVHFDRAFLKYHLNTFESRFAYRNIDVSTIKELAQRWYPTAYETRPGQNDEDKAHRAYDDVLASIAELRHYVDSGFITLETPDPTGVEHG